MLARVVLNQAECDFFSEILETCLALTHLDLSENMIFQDLFDYDHSEKNERFRCIMNTLLTSELTHLNLAQTGIDDEKAMMLAGMLVQLASLRFAPGLVQLDLRGNGFSGLGLQESTKKKLRHVWKGPRDGLLL